MPQHYANLLCIATVVLNYSKALKELITAFEWLPVAMQGSIYDELAIGLSSKMHVKPAAENLNAEFD